MSRTIHAFESYSVEGENEYCLEIVYKNDMDYDIALGNWKYIYKVLIYGETLLNLNVDIPVYNYLDDADFVKEKGMDLVEPDVFVKICEAVIFALGNLSDRDNPVINGDKKLFVTNNDISLDQQKENLIYYAEKLLNWAKQGLYFVEERE